MALFYAAIKRYSIFLMRFSLLSHVQAFSCEISLVCLLQYAYSCFSSHICFLVFYVFLFILILLLLLLTAAIILSVFFFIYFSRPCIDHHQHHVVPQARISLILSHHFSQSFIPSGRSSELHPVSSHSCCMYVRAGPPAFARPYVGVHKSTSLMSSSLLLQQCPECLVRLTWIVFVMGGRWPYSWCFVGCCCQDLFNIARNILV